MSFSKWRDLSTGTNRFNLLTLTLEFDLLFENFNLANNLRTVNSRDFIFHKSIPWDKIFQLGINHLTLTYDLLLKEIETGHNFSIHARNIRTFKLHMIISCGKIFLLVSRYLSFWSWSSLELAIIGTFVFHKHVLFFRLIVSNNSDCFEIFVTSFLLFNLCL